MGKSLTDTVDARAALTKIANTELPATATSWRFTETVLNNVMVGILAVSEGLAADTTLASATVVFTVLNVATGTRLAVGAIVADFA